MPASKIDACPLFVLGVPRSGTTLLARLLNDHPEIVQTYETAAFLLFDRLIKGTAQGAGKNIIYGKEYADLWSSHLAEVAQNVIEGYYLKIFAKEARAKVRYWGDKHPHHNACLPFLRTLYPHARYIYIVRDPRDVACSIAQMNRIDFDQAFEIWRKNSGWYESDLDATDPKVLTVRYEDIVQDYEGRMKAILQWLDVPPDEGYLERVRLRRNTDVHNFYKGKTDFAQTSLARWRTTITPEQNQAVIDTAEKYLERYGFDWH